MCFDKRKYFPVGIPTDPRFPWVSYFPTCELGRGGAGEESRAALLREENDWEGQQHPTTPTTPAHYAGGSDTRRSMHCTATL